MASRYEPTNSFNDEEHLKEGIKWRRMRIRCVPRLKLFTLRSPIFGHAQSIIAICIASVSRFWTDSEVGAAAGDYLKDQKESAQSIRRLFVFKSASELIDFKEVLRIHYKMYGFKHPTNGVFVSSLQGYRDFMGLVGIDIDSSSPLRISAFLALVIHQNECTPF